MSKTYSIFHIEGGLGKHVAATAVAKCIKSTHPDRQLIVVCSYPEIFLNLTFVDKVYRHGNTPYFYDTYIDGADSLIFKHEPYFTTEHIHKKLPLIENWCKLYNLEYNGEQPEIVFNMRNKQFGENIWRRPKPVMVIQTNGGPMEGQRFPYSWSRDIPYSLAQKIVDHYSLRFHVIQICRHEANALSGAEVINQPLSNMELFSLLNVSKKNILIDSCLQHAAAAMKKPSVVLWVGTSPKVFGYDIHTNLVADIPKSLSLPDSYLFDFSFNGEIHECPFLEDNFFTLAEIIEAVKE